MHGGLSVQSFGWDAEKPRSRLLISLLCASKIPILKYTKYLLFLNSAVDSLFVYWRLITPPTAQGLLRALLALGLKVKHGRCTHVDHTGAVTALQVVQHRGLIEVSHVGHVLDLLELGRVHLLDVILLEGLGLQNNDPKIKKTSTLRQTSTQIFLTSTCFTEATVLRNQLKKRNRYVELGCCFLL